MKNYTKTIIILLIVILGLFFLLHFFGETFMASFSPDMQISKDIKENTKVAVGSDAPYFDLPLVIGGRANSLDVRDNPLVLTFWSTWNSESVDQMKIFDDYLSSLTNENRESSARILTITSQEIKSTVLNVLRRGGYKLEVLNDESGEIGNMYGIQTLPTTFFINREGKILEIFVGTMSRTQLVDKMDKIIR